MRVGALVFAVAVAVAIGLAGGGSASARANPPGPGLSPVSVDYEGGQPVCRPPKAPKCAPPKKFYPQKPEPHPYSDCRWAPYYPSTYLKVKCVMVYNGQAGNWWLWACIADRESGWNPYATGSAGERGIFQIHPVHVSWLGWYKWSQLYDPVTNAWAAVTLYRRAGYSFSPWTTHGRCI